MKRIVSFLVFSMIFSLITFAQTNEKADERLLVKYSQEELNQMEKESPEMVEYLNYCLDHSFTIMEYPEEKSPELQVVVIEDLDNINIFELNIEIDETKFVYYKIAGTDKMLVVKSKKFILENINKN